MTAADPMRPSKRQRQPRPLPSRQSTNARPLPPVRMTAGSAPSPEPWPARVAISGSTVGCPNPSASGPMVRAGDGPQARCRTPQIGISNTVTRRLRPAVAAMFGRGCMSIPNIRLSRRAPNAHGQVSSRIASGFGQWIATPRSVRRNAPAPRTAKQCLPSAIAALDATARTGSGVRGRGTGHVTRPKRSACRATR